MHPPPIHHRFYSPPTLPQHILALPLSASSSAGGNEGSRKQQDGQEEDEEDGEIELLTDQVRQSVTLPSCAPPPQAIAAP